MIIEQISQGTGVSSAYISTVASTADHRYREYTVPKRTEGERTIHHPSPELKFLQRWIVRNVLSHLPVHAAATAYKEGSSVKANASAHLTQRFLLKIDFRDFFPSILSDDVKHLLNQIPGERLQLTEEDKDLVTQIVCRNGRLTIGAPSSPFVSNALLYPLDSKISEFCADIGVIYSRYADDCYFSTNTPDILTRVHSNTEQILTELTHPSLTINRDKTVFTSKKRRRVVTGVVLTSDGRLSVGRKKKREISAMMHRFKLGQLEPDAVSYLKGYLAYVSSIEPEFISRLSEKYGTDLMDKLIGSLLVQRKPAYKTEPD